MLEMYRNSTTEKRLIKLDQPEPRCWFSVTSPTADELKKLSDILNITPDSLQDSIDPNELPRIKFENDNVIVFLRAAKKDKSEYRTVPMTIILNSNFNATITLSELNIIQDIITDPKTYKFSHKSNFMINIIQSIVHYNEHYINSINMAIAGHQHTIKSIQKDDILIDDLVLNQNVFRKLHSVEKLNFYEDDKKLIDDLIHDGEQVIERGKSNLKAISNHREGLATVLNLRLNKIMEVLTYVMVFYSIPTVMAGLFGMNLALPWKDHPMGFFIILGISMILVMLTFLGLWLTLKHK